MEPWMIPFFALGIVFGVALVIPWISLPIQCYWDWCRKVQRKMRND